MFRRIITFWKIHKATAGSRLKRIVLGLIIWGLITGVIFADLDSEKVFMESGDVSRRDIAAPKTITFTSSGSGTQNDIKEDIGNLFAYLKNDPEIEDERKLKGLQLWDELGLHSGVIDHLADLEGTERAGLERMALDFIIPYANKGVAEDKLKSLRKNLTLKISALALPDHSKELLVTLMGRLLEDVPEIKTIKKGEMIIRRGDQVTPEDLYVLKELELYEDGDRSRLNIIGGCIVSILLFASVLVFLFRFRPNILESDSLLGMLGIVAVVTLALSKIVIMLSQHGVPFRGENIFSPYLSPLASASMLVTLLMGADLAILITAVLAILIGLMGPAGIKLTITLFFGGLAGIFTVFRVSQRSDIIQAGFFVSLAQVSFLVGLTLLGAEGTFSDFSREMFRDAIAGFIGGITATILTLGGLPYLENFFKITTSIKLLELSDLNQPLMQELLVKAPGTYHHSIIVANMAEAAAELIGADPLLCKIGGYYHDIGKLKRPYFFVENQIGIENQHEALSPYLSVLVISSHVKDGVELAKQFNLADPICDIIGQHQGTGLITYFHHRACEQAGSPEDVREEDFRYPGPKPRTKEASLVMLADAIESATRTLSSPTPSNIKNMVAKITRGKFEDGQLNDCDITLKDLERINKTFSTILTGMYHSRIEYPEEPVGNLKKRIDKKTSGERKSKKVKSAGGQDGSISTKKQQKNGRKSSDSKGEHTEQERRDTTEKRKRKKQNNGNLRH